MLTVTTVAKRDIQSDFPLSTVAGWVERSDGKLIDFVLFEGLTGVTRQKLILSLDWHLCLSGRRLRADLNSNVLYLRPGYKALNVYLEFPDTQA